jgi:hypothetical protein
VAISNAIINHAPVVAAWHHGARGIALGRIVFTAALGVFLRQEFFGFTLFSGFIFLVSHNYFSFVELLRPLSLRRNRDSIEFQP